MSSLDNYLNPTAASFSPFPPPPPQQQQQPQRKNLETTKHIEWVCRGCGDPMNDAVVDEDLTCNGCRLVLDICNDTQPADVDSPVTNIPSNSHIFTQNVGTSMSGDTHEDLAGPPITSIVVPKSQNQPFNNRANTMVCPNRQTSNVHFVNHPSISIIISDLGLRQDENSVQIVESLLRLQAEAHFQSEDICPIVSSDHFLEKPKIISSKAITLTSPQVPMTRESPIDLSEPSPALPLPLLSTNQRSIMKLKNPKSQALVDIKETETYQVPHRNLYVANFADSIQEEHMKDMFSSFCEVRRVVMKDVIDKNTTKFKGRYCFVWTGSIEQSTRAKNALHNMKLNGKKLQVKFAREGSFKITSMMITTDALGNSNRKVVTLRSDDQKQEQNQ